MTKEKQSPLTPSERMGQFRLKIIGGLLVSMTNLYDVNFHVFNHKN